MTTGRAARVQGLDLDDVIGGQEPPAQLRGQPVERGALAEVTGDRPFPGRQDRRGVDGDELVVGAAELVLVDREVLPIRAGDPHRRRPLPHQAAGETRVHEADRPVQPVHGDRSARHGGGRGRDGRRCRRA